MSSYMLHIAQNNCPNCKKQYMVALHHIVHNHPNPYPAAKGLICLNCAYERSFKKGTQPVGFYTEKYCFKKVLDLPGQFNPKAAKIVMANKTSQNTGIYDDYSSYDEEDDDEDQDYEDTSGEEDAYEYTFSDEEDDEYNDDDEDSDEDEVDSSGYVNNPSTNSFLGSASHQNKSYQPTAQDFFQQAMYLWDRWDRQIYNSDIQQLFENAAGMGHIEAPYYLALYYKMCGRWDEDLEAAIKWFDVAIKCGCNKAQVQNGEFYFELAGIAEGRQWHNLIVLCYEKAANAGHAEAQNNLAVIYVKGQLVPINLEKAVFWYQNAAKNNSVYGQRNLANCYLQGQGVKQDYIQAAYWLEKAAKNQDQEATEQLAKVAYEIGLKLKNAQEQSEKKRAFEYFEKALEYGSNSALFELGLCYANGFGISQDYAHAVKYYQRAAELGSIPAQNNIGVIYDSYYNDYQTAVKWYLKAAENKEANAQKNLAYCYKNGNGVKQDLLQAVYWFEKASEQGDEQAEKELTEVAYAVGQDFYKQNDVTQKDKCYTYFLKAFKHGKSKAILNIALCYENGYGVEQDYATAVKWYEQAVQRKINKAEEWMADCYYKWGCEYIDDRDGEAALACLEKAADLDNSDAILKAAECFVNGDYVRYGANDEVALEWLQRANGLLHNDKMLDFYKGFAQKCEDYGDNERALFWFQQAATMDDEKAIIWIAKYYYGKKEYAEAIDWYEKVCFLEDNHNRYYRCFLELAREANARGYSFDASEYYDKLLADEQAMLFAEKEIEGFNVIANFYLSRGNYIDALKWFDLINEHCELEPSELDKLAGNYLATAQELTNEGLIHDARSWYESASRLSLPKTVTAYVNFLIKYNLTWADLDELTNRFAKAIEGNYQAYLEQLIACCLTIGQSLLDETDYLRALRWFDLIENMVKECGFKLFSYLDSEKLLKFKFIGDYYYQEYLQAQESPDDYNLAQARAWYEKIYDNAQSPLEYLVFMGQVCIKRREYSMAIINFAEAIKSGSKNALCELAWMFTNGHGVNQDLRKAEELFLQAYHQIDRAIKDLEEFSLRGYASSETRNIITEYYRKNSKDVLSSWDIQQNWQEKGEEAYTLGLKLMTSQNEEDRKKAAWNFKKAINYGYDYAHYKLACCFVEGIGVNQNCLTAVKYFEKAESLSKVRSIDIKDIAIAFIKIAQAFVAQENTQNALEWYQKAAELSQEAKIELEIFKYRETAKRYKLVLQENTTSILDELLRSCLSIAERTFYNKKSIDEVVHWFELAEQYLERNQQLRDILTEEQDLCFIKLGEYYFQKYLDEGEQNEKRSLQLSHQWYQKSKSPEFELIYRGRVCLANAKYDLAQEYFFQAIENGVNNALCELAWMYVHEQGFQLDLSKAEQLLIEAHHNSVHRAIGDLREFCLQGYGTDKAKNIVLNYFEAQANEGDYWALEVAEWYEKGCIVTQNYQKALEYYLRIAQNSGSSKQDEALFKIGYFYQNGLGVAQNYEKAVEYFKIGTENTWLNSACHNSLGECYFNGLGVPENYKKAFEHCHISADNGYPEGMFNLGFLYENGFGIKQDYVKAIEWYESARDAGFDLASKALADLERRKDEEKNSSNSIDFSAFNDLAD